MKDHEESVRVLEEIAERMTVMIGSPDGVPKYVRELLDMDPDLFFGWINIRVEGLLEMLGLDPEHVPAPLAVILATACSGQFCAGVEYARMEQMAGLEKAVAGEPFDPDGD